MVAMILIESRLFLLAAQKKKGNEGKRIKNGRPEELFIKVMQSLGGATWRHSFLWTNWVAWDLQLN